MKREAYFLEDVRTTGLESGLHRVVAQRIGFHRVTSTTAVLRSG